MLLKVYQFDILQTNTNNLSRIKLVPMFVECGRVIYTSIWFTLYFMTHHAILIIFLIKWRFAIVERSLWLFVDICVCTRAHVEHAICVINMKWNNTFCQLIIICQQKNLKGIYYTLDSKSFSRTNPFLIYDLVLVNVKFALWNNKKISHYNRRLTSYTKETFDYNSNV